MIFFAAASANQNDLVEKEVRKAGATEVHVSSGGVEFEADLETAYRFSLWTRCSTRLLVLICRNEKLESTDDLFDFCSKLPWENWLSCDNTFAITQTVTDCRWIRNSHFAALRLKDAVVERLRTVTDGNRPNVDRDNPDITFHLHVNRNLVSLYVDFAGRGLSHRGYRTAQTDAVMSEFMACSLLYRSDWYKYLETDSTTLLDPFCGSGTICIEAALIATNTAPGLLDPDSFAFFKLPIHNEEIWRKVFDEAEDQQRECPCKIIGWDKNPKAVAISKQNAKNAGVDHLIDFEVHDFTQITQEQIDAVNELSTGKYSGCVVTDPPYGVRLNEGTSFIRNLYSQMGKVFYELFSGWFITVISSDSSLLGYIEMKPDRTNILINGGLKCQAAHYYVFSKAEREELVKKAQEKRELRLNTPLSEGAQMAANRLKKNIDSIGKEMKKQGVSCYRLYDADMPEYSAAIDIYEDKWISLQEYAAPASIKEEDAKRRLDELILATERTTGIDLENIFVKRREIQRGSNQYVKKSAPSASHFFIINENGHKFNVNFQDYLDTGIFLDHRPIRKYIEENSKDKRFLNLFCYTASATVYAAAGGALSTVSVDASSAYLDWAVKNMRMNGFTQMNHFFYRDDCLEYLKHSDDQFDLIFCDPPTFSNSKSRNSFDVQRDHVFLVDMCMKHLSPNGTLIFSTNYTRFHLDEGLEEKYEIENVTEMSIGDDFKRNSKIHRCYIIKKKTVAAKRIHSVRLKTKA